MGSEKGGKCDEKFESDEKSMGVGSEKSGSRWQLRSALKINNTYHYTTML